MMDSSQGGDASGWIYKQCSHWYRSPLACVWRWDLFRIAPALCSVWRTYVGLYFWILSSSSENLRGSETRIQFLWNLWFLDIHGDILYNACHIRFLDKNVFSSWKCDKTLEVGVDYDVVYVSLRWNLHLAIWSAQTPREEILWSSTGRQWATRRLSICTSPVALCLDPSNT